MNDERRKKLRDAIKMLDSAACIVESVCDAEEDCMYNTPENLQGTERYEMMENGVDALNEAVEKIGEAKEQIQTVI